MIVLAIIALILSFDKTSDWVGDKMGVAGDKLQYYARTALGFLVGGIVISLGILAGGPIAIGCAVIGLAVAVYALWPFIAGDHEEPENTKLEKLGE